jgi:hypothetical protein
MASLLLTLNEISVAPLQDGWEITNKILRFLSSTPEGRIHDGDAHFQSAGLVRLQNVCPHAFTGERIGVASPSGPHLVTAFPPFFQGVAHHAWREYVVRARNARFTPPCPQRRVNDTRQQTGLAVRVLRVHACKFPRSVTRPY